jgi:hypothetical protein
MRIGSMTRTCYKWRIRHRIEQYPHIGIRPVILVKLIVDCSGSGGGVEELVDLGPGQFLVAGVADSLGQELLGLGDEAGQGVQSLSQ